jgi:hypothetical protein
VKTPGKKVARKTAEDVLSSFLRGFGDAAKLTPAEAIIQWNEFAGSLGYGERRDLEEGGYAAGCFCALSYTNPT